jgi:hypothetical protein
VNSAFFKIMARLRKAYFTPVLNPMLLANPTFFLFGGCQPKQFWSATEFSSWIDVAAA